MNTSCQWRSVITARAVGVSACHSSIVRASDTERGRQLRTWCGPRRRPPQTAQRSKTPRHLRYSRQVSRPHGPPQTPDTSPRCAGNPSDTDARKLPQTQLAHFLFISLFIHYYFTVQHFTDYHIKKYCYYYYYY